MPSSASPANGNSPSGFTFQKCERLTRKSDFSDLIKRGRKIKAENLLFYVRKNSLPFNRFGVAAPVKIGNAFIRNRCKRRLRELFRTNKAVLDKGFDILAVVKIDVSGKRYEQLKEEFVGALKMLNVK